MSERDYILGTHDAEIERLHLQHRVWRARMFDAWRRAGVTQGQTVVDVGSGPGYATRDLSEIVGSKGRVIAMERSARFLDVLHKDAERTGLANITAVEGDITETPIGDRVADASWCRWVFSWLTKPEFGVANIARALKPGGVAVFHEYLHYASWSLAPRSAAFSEFTSAVIASVAKTGAHIDVALQLPALLEQAGFDIVALNPIVDVVGSDNYTWRWPAAFVHAFNEKLVAEGLISAETAEQAQADLDQAEKRGGRMVTPTVLEIIARRR